MNTDELEIVGVERTEDGLIITFSNGASALFRPQFLFDTRQQDGNIPLEEPDRDRGIFWKKYKDSH